MLTLFSASLPYVLRDTFNKAVFGTLDVGGAWTVTSGTPPIISAGQLVAQDIKPIYADAGKADGTIRATLISGYTNVMFRWSASQFWYIQSSPTAFSSVTTLVLNVGGTLTVYSSIESAPTTPHTIQAVLSGSRILIKRGGTIISAWSSAINQTATKHGFAPTAINATFDDFAQTLDTPGNAGNLSGLPAAFFFHGDSITAGYNSLADTDKYPVQLMTSGALSVSDWLLWGKSGDKASLNTTPPYLALFDGTRPKNCAVVLFGTNDISAGDTAATVYANLKLIWAALYTAGFKVIAATLLPFGASFEAARSALNTLIKSDTSLYDALADFAANAVIGQAGQNTNTAYYQADAVHPNAAGWGIMAGVVRPAATSMLGGVVSISDSFNRANTTQIMGVADTGQAWTYLGAHGFSIQSNQMVATAVSGEEVAYIDARVADCTVSVQIETTADCSLAFRITNLSNFWIVQCTASNVTLLKRVAGSYINPQYAAAASVGDTISVVLLGASIIVKRNGATIITLSDSFNQSATKHGLRTGTLNQAWDNFTISAP